MMLIFLQIPLRNGSHALVNIEKIESIYPSRSHPEETWIFTHGGVSQPDHIVAMPFGEMEGLLKKVIERLMVSS